MTNNLPAEKKQEVYSMLTKNMASVKNVLPKHVTAERMLRIAYQAIVQNPTLAECSQISLMNALIESSQLGLEIGGPLGHAYLIPFKGKATLVVGYKGFMDLAYRSGRVSNFSAQPVYEKDHFLYSYGLEPKLEHVPSDEEDPGDLKAAYAIVHFKGGGFDFEVVTKRDAKTTKRRSPGAKKPDSPWNTEDEWTMWVKTAIRKLAKRTPLSPEIQRAAALDEYADAGMNQNITHVIDADFCIEPNKQTRTTKDKLKDKAKELKTSKSTVECPKDNKTVSINKCDTCESAKGCPANE